MVSVAMEKMGLSHILNAEAEIIQYALGTLPGLTPKPNLKEVYAALHVNAIRLLLKGISVS